MIEIKLAKADSPMEEIQNVFNHSTIIAQLGGFTHLQSVKDKAKNDRPSLWYACLDGGPPVGAAMVAGRAQSHYLKYGEIGVIKEYRRQRIGSALYLAMTLQGILEGRRLFEDTIVGDNPTQFDVLPTLGLYQAGELKHRTASGKSICLFQFSLIHQELATMVKRVPTDGVRIHLRENYYTKDLWEKNMEVLDKHLPQTRIVMERYRYGIHEVAKSSGRYHIDFQEGHPNDARRKPAGQQTPRGFFGG